MPFQGHQHVYNWLQISTMTGSHKRDLIPVRTHWSYVLNEPNKMFCPVGSVKCCWVLFDGLGGKLHYLQVLTLYVQNCLWRIIVMCVYFMTSLDIRQQKLLKIILKEDQHLLNMNNDCQYHACWWWSDVRSQGAVSVRKTVLPGMAIPMLKIRRPNGRLIFNMEIAIRR